MVGLLLKYGLSEAITKLAPFLTSFYVAYLLGAEDFGRYSLLVVVFEIVFILVSFNIQATTRIDYFKKTKEAFLVDKKHHFLISIVLSFLILLIISMLEYLSLEVAFCVFFSALFRTFSVFVLALLQCQKKSNAYIFVNISYVFSLSLSTILIFDNGYDVVAWFFVLLLSSFIQLIFSLLSFNKLEGYTSDLKILFNKDVLLSTLSFSILFFPQSIGWWIKSGMERFIIEHSFGEVVLGNYALVFQISSILVILVNTINLVIVPEIGKKIDTNFRGVIKLIGFMSFLVIIVSIAVAFLGIVFIDEFYGEQYLLSKDYLYLLILSSIPQSLMLLLINILYFKGETRFVAKLIFLGYLTYSIFILVLSDQLQMQGILIFSAFSNSLMLFIVLYKLRSILVYKY